MEVLAFTLALFWLVTLIVAQRNNRDHYNWRDKDISSLIKYSNFLQLGFISLAASLILTGVYFGSYAILLFTISGIGALGVMLTMKSTNSLLHVLSALACYLLALAGCIAYAPNDITQGLAIGNLLLLIYGGIIRDEIGDLERYLALALITWLGVICFI